jgi:hypothetical protein
MENVQAILLGLVGGVHAMVYILCLLCMVLYIYGVLGFVVFHNSDPFHFGRWAINTHAQTCEKSGQTIVHLKRITV